MEAEWDGGRWPGYPIGGEGRGRPHGWTGQVGHSRHGDKTRGLSLGRLAEPQLCTTEAWGISSCGSHWVSRSSQQTWLWGVLQRNATAVRHSSRKPLPSLIQEGLATLGLRALVTQNLSVVSTPIAAFPLSLAHPTQCPVLFNSAGECRKLRRGSAGAWASLSPVV